MGAIASQLAVRNISGQQVCVQEVGSMFDSEPLLLTPGDCIQLSVGADNKGREYLYVSRADNRDQDCLGWSTNTLFAQSRRAWVMNVKSHESEAAEEQWKVTVSRRDSCDEPIALSAMDVTQPTLEVPEKHVYMGGGNFRIL